MDEASTHLRGNERTGFEPVPTGRLLLWVALTALPFALVAGIAPETRGICVAGLCCLGFIAIMDAVTGLFALRDLTVDLPALARVSVGREVAIDLLCANRGTKAREVRLALALPTGLLAVPETARVTLPAATAAASVSLVCRGVTRGRHCIHQCHIETRSPLGWWSVRSRFCGKTEVRVYPDLLTERRGLAALFLTRGGLGVHAHRQVGKGRDFERLRDYAPGDSFDDIDWKATARRGKPVTKVFQVERTQEVYVLIDTSRLSGRPADPQNPGGANVLERFITAALVMGLAAERQGDLFGVVTFNEQVRDFVRARNGKAHYSVCRDLIYASQPNLVTPDFAELFSCIRLRLRRRALLVILTSLDSPALAEAFARDAELVARHHLVLVNMIHPPETTPLFSGEPAHSVDDIYTRLGGHLRWQQLHELEAKLARHGIVFTQLENARLCVDLVTQYMNIKQRQIL